MKTKTFEVDEICLSDSIDGSAIGHFEYSEHEGFITVESIRVDLINFENIVNGESVDVSGALAMQAKAIIDEAVRDAVYHDGVGEGKTLKTSGMKASAV